MRGFVGIKQTNTKNKIMETQVALTQDEIAKHNTVINKKLWVLNFGRGIFKSWEYSSKRITPTSSQNHYILWSAKKTLDIDPSSLGLFAPAIKDMCVEIEAMFDGISYRIDLNYQYKHLSLIHI